MSLTKTGQDDILAGIVAIVTSQQEVLDQKVTSDLNVACEILRQTGRVSLKSEQVVNWQGVNQFTLNSQQIRLPQMLASDTWLGQNTDVTRPSPVVDRVSTNLQILKNKRAISEMDKVEQQNAANVEESASAAEEMNAQAEQLKDYVVELVLTVTGKSGQEHTAARRQPARSIRTYHPQTRAPAKSCLRKRPER